MPQYTRNPPLLESAVDQDPIIQFRQWLDDAIKVGMIEPIAMTLATVDADGRPSARVVLLKGLDADGFAFYTNYQSRKARALAVHPFAAATFWWDRLERSVRIEGAVEKLTAADSEAYFRSRPQGSQVGAITSRQSQVIGSRAELDARLADNLARYASDPVPFDASQWGGYRIRPEVIEFWQGRDNRSHDRLRYRRSGAGSWIIERLEP